MELLALGFEEKRHTERHQQCANTKRQRLDTPDRERRRFRYADIDDKGIVAQRTSSHQSSFTIEDTCRSVGPTALQNKRMPGRFCRYFLASANDLIRVANDDSAVAVQQCKPLIGQ